MLNRDMRCCVCTEYAVRRTLRHGRFYPLARQLRRRYNIERVMRIVARVVDYGTAYFIVRCVGYVNVKTN